MADKDPRLVKAQEAAKEALDLHVTYRGKIPSHAEVFYPNFL